MRWWFFRSKASIPETNTLDPSAPEAVSPHSAAARLLDLQQSVGNQAVQRMITVASPEEKEAVQSHTAHTGGEALPQDMRESLAVRFGEGFSDVRMHAAEPVATTADTLDARAYTSGRDVYFARGMYAPKDPEGQRRIAHEMAYGNEGYERFRPVYRSGDQLVVSELPLSPELRENIKCVLAFYDVPFKEDPNGELLIPKRDGEDLEMMWNYTTKANDPAWLKAHQGIGNGLDKGK